MEQAVAAATARSPISLPTGQEASFEGATVEGDWAIAGGPIRDTKTGAVDEAEGVFVILRRTQGAWQAAYPGTPEFEAWLNQVPDTLLSPQTKQALR